MPIMAAQDQNDARGTVRLLATAAKDFLGDSAIALDRDVTLNNVYRLLEAYRTHPFFGLEVPLKSTDDTPEALTLMPPPERHVDDVHDALQDALGASFKNSTPHESLDLIERVLKALAGVKDAGQPSNEDREKTRDFFDKLINSLHFA